MQTSSSVWLFKEYDFVLADLNISAFTTLCCSVVAIWCYQLLSCLTSDSRSEPINFYNILASDRHDLTLSIISYLQSDRRSDANTIHIHISRNQRCNCDCTKVFILRFLLKDRKRITVIYIYSTKARLTKTVLRQRLKDVVVDRWSLMVKLWASASAGLQSLATWFTLRFTLCRVV